MKYGCPKCGKQTENPREYDDEWIQVGAAWDESVVCSWECVAKEAADRIAGVGAVVNIDGVEVALDSSEVTP